MPHLLSFVCAALDMPYEGVYAELAGYLELDVDTTVKRFAPDDAVSRVRYHRRQASRRGIQQQLAELLGLDAGTVYAAVSEAGAQILLEALVAKQKATRPTLTLTTRLAEPPAVLLDELADAMAR